MKSSESIATVTLSLLLLFSAGCAKDRSLDASGFTKYSQELWACDRYISEMLGPVLKSGSNFNTLLDLRRIPDQYPESLFAEYILSVRTLARAEKAIDVMDDHQIDRLLPYFWEAAQGSRFESSGCHPALFEHLASQLYAHLGGAEGKVGNALAAMGITDTGRQKRVVVAVVFSPQIVTPTAE